ncbi:MAG: carboxymuconolactone decarboxylase family protein [Planctomycetota bacterium]
MHHASNLLRASEDEKFVKAIAHNPKTAEVSSRHRAILDYVIPLTEQPGSVRESHVLVLREQGLSDEEILNVNLVCCLFNWVNRVADGVGIPLEDKCLPMAEQLELKPYH